MKKARIFLLSLLCLGLMTFAVVGCSDEEEPYPDMNGFYEEELALPAMRIGTLSTDDLLPLWVALEEGLLADAGLDVEIIPFQSGQDQLAAITAGEIDGMMTDMVVATLLYEGGTPVRAITTMQGAPAGIVVGADTSIESLEELAGVPVAISTPTVIEYTAYKALTAAGVDSDDIEYEIIPSLSTRYQMLMEGNVDAAGLPWTLLALAEQEGATVLLDRDEARGITSTVLALSQDFLDGNPVVGEATTAEAATAAVEAVLAEWDNAVGMINATPDAYRELLIEAANLPEPLRDSYPVPEYPLSQIPSAEHWNDVLEWMRDKGYLTVDVGYDDLVFQP
ncbi:MAG: ABC transporter substrate-binding protein [Coriobacteriia bacterium]|nr:ABC transporter substrate-binding protein [Coriobacteriia bacterium]